EFDGLLPLCRSVKALDWPVAWARTAVLKGRQVTLAANGAGPQLARAVLDAAQPNAVVSVGFCGGLDPALKIGDVFVATGIQIGDAVEAAQDPRSGRDCFRGILVSRNRVAQTIEEKRDLRSGGAAAVEMEAAGMLPRVREWGMPFYCIRSVTDLAAESFGLDFNAVRDADGRFSTPRILAAAIQRPFTVAPELIELRRRCAIAA